MDLLSTIRKTGSRGGVNFSWDEVANSSRRENYLGHSLKAPVGRWQRGKDLNWYAKADATAANANETQEEREARERKEELRKVKEAEEDAIARALGLPIKQRDTTGANSVEVADKRQIGPASGPEQAEQSATDGERRTSEKSHRHRDEDGRDRDTRRRRRSRSRSRERNRDDGERRRHRSRSLDRWHRDRRQRSREKEDGTHHSEKVNMVRGPVATVFGGTRIGNRELFKPETNLESFLTILRVHNITSIDTAQAYGNSETALGQVCAGERFTLDTKWSPSSWTGTTPWATKNRIIETAEASVQKLGAAAGIFYLHQIDRLTPFPETLAAVNEVYQRGHFRRFGLSGFPPKDIEAVYNHCVERGYPLPAVYQGSYNPLNRDKETALLPVLRRLGMAFYAFGPSAGGFLGKTVTQAEQMKSNIDSVSATCKPYLSHPKYLEALARWNALAETEGLSAAEMAYRWMAHHSALEGEKGDALIIGASSPEQLEESLVGIERGPLSDEACAGIQQIWETVAGAG
ncbi:hypothetical protein ARSEF4850_004638 [Beauveria asiatica]